MCCQDKFIEQLRGRGFRLTPQREMVLQVMHDIDGHATAEEINTRVQVLSSCVDISTVYRTLELLEEFHLVASVDLGDGQRRYELLSEHGNHHHLHCRACGKLVRVEPAALQPLLDALNGGYGFQADLPHMVFSGLCETCRTAGGARG